MTLTWEAVSVVLAVVAAVGAWIRSSTAESVRLAVSEMKAESLRAIAELRADSDERYPSKAEWQFLAQELSHIREKCDRRHDHNR